MFEVVPRYLSKLYFFFIKSNSSWLIHTKNSDLSFRFVEKLGPEHIEKYLYYINLQIQKNCTYGNSLWSKKKLKGGKNMLQQISVA